MAAANGTIPRARIVSSADARSFFDAHPTYATPFMEPRFADAVGQMYGRPPLYVAVDNGADTVAIAVIHPGGRREGNNIPYRGQGINTREPGSLVDQVIAIRRLLRGHGIGKVTYNLAPELSSDPRPYDRMGMARHCGSTMVLSLETTTKKVEGGRTFELFAATQSRMRGKIRSALRAGLAVRPTTGDDMERHLIPLLEATYAKQNSRSGYPLNSGRVLWERFSDDSRFIARTAEFRGRIVGIGVAFVHGDTLFSLHFADDDSNPEIRTVQVNGALVTEMGKAARAQGCRRYDLGGGPPGIQEFKRRMGGRRSEQLTLSVVDPLSIPLHSAHTVARRVKRALTGRQLGFLTI